MFQYLLVVLHKLICPCFYTCSITVYESLASFMIGCVCCHLLFCVASSQCL
jgi:hypothetical protein